MDTYDGTTVICETDSLSDDYLIDESKLKMVARTVCLQLGVPDHELSITLTDSQEIQRLNFDFRGFDKSTDVLSFPQNEWPKPLLAQDQITKISGKKTKGPPPMLGDVVISIPDAENNAKNIGQGLDREIAFLLVHGILHLCGHDHIDPKDEELMIAQQQKLMTTLEPEDAPGAPLWADVVRTLQQERRV